VSADVSDTDPLPEQARDRRTTGCAFCERDAEGMVAGKRVPACARCAAALDEFEEPIVVTDDVEVPDV